MSVLNDSQIISAINDNYIGIEPLAKDHIQPASIDLTLDDSLETVEADVIDLAHLADGESKCKIVSIPEDGYKLSPGEYVIGQTAEMLSFSTGFNGRICNKNSLVRWGLDISAGNFINPGFKGHMPLVIRNFGKAKIILRKGVLICQLEIRRFESPSIRNYENRHDPDALTSDVPDWERWLERDNRKRDRTFSDFLHRRIQAGVR